MKIYVPINTQGADPFLPRSNLLKNVIFFSSQKIPPSLAPSPFMSLFTANYVQDGGSTRTGSSHLT